MKPDPEHVNCDDNALLALIDTVDLESQDFIVIDFPDCITQRDDNVSVDYTDLLEFEF